MFRWSQLELMYTSMLRSEAAAVDKLHSLQLEHKSLLQLSLELENGSSISRKFRHPSLRRVYFVIASLVKEIGAAFHSLRLVDDDTYDAIMQHFRWLQYFVRVCQLPVGSRSGKECISEIAVHWNWLHRKLIVSLRGIGFEFSQQLSEAMQHLESSFGVDEAATKIQRTVESLSGHPHPFSSCSEADAFTEAHSLCRRLERKSDETVDNVRISLRSDVRKIKLSIADCLLTLDQGNVEDCVAVLKELLNAVNTECDLEDAELSTLVALYPICQLLAEMSEADFFADSWNRVTRSSSEVSHFVSFCSHCTVVSPLTLAYLKYMLSSSVHGMDGSLSVSRSLMMRTVMLQEGDTYSGMLFCNLSYQIVSLLSLSESSQSSHDAVSFLSDDFTLGGGEARCSQLSGLNRLLWTNAELLSGLKWNMYKSDCCLLAGTFHHLISSLQSFLPAELFSMIDSCLASTAPEMYADAGERIFAAAANSSKIAKLVPDWPSQLSNCLQRIGRLHSSADDRCKKVVMLGAGWVEVGLFKMQLLAPRGPVDPNYRLALKLMYAEEQLECIERELRVHNWQSVLSTGQELPTDCHPMIDRLYRRQAKLSRWISEKRKLVAYRPELARYLALVRDVWQFMHGLGSSERIRDLVDRLAKSFESEIPSQATIDEFTTFKAAVGAFVSCVERDYLLYCDITVPFLNAVAETTHGLDLIVNAVRTAASRQMLYSSLRCHHGILNTFVHHLVQFPVSAANVNSDLWRTICQISFDALLKYNVTSENVIAPARLQIRYICICYVYFFSSNVSS